MKPPCIAHPPAFTAPSCGSSAHAGTRVVQPWGTSSRNDLSQWRLRSTGAELDNSVERFVASIGQRRTCARRSVVYVCVDVHKRMSSRRASLLGDQRPLSRTSGERDSPGSILASCAAHIPLSSVRIAGTESGSHYTYRLRDAKRMPPGSELQFALAGVESGSH